MINKVNKNKFGISPGTIRIRGSNKKDRRILKLVASLDHFIVRLVLALIVLYMLTYAYFISGGFTFGQPSWHYAAIIIPIWLIDGFKGLIETFIPAKYKDSMEDLSKVTVVIPSMNGGDSLGKTLQDLTQRFSKNHIIVVSNGSTDNTVALAQSYGVICLDIAAAVGKVRAINLALGHITTPYALLIDDDTLIGKAHIPTSLLDDGYEGVAFRVLVNVSTWITKLQMYEYRKSTDIGKRYHNHKASVQNISGAIGLFKLTELKRQINRHTNEFAGEDLQRTLLVHLASKSNGVMLADSTVYTDPPATFVALFNQRTLGWFPGLYINFSNYLKLIFKKGVPAPLRYDAFYNSFLVTGLDILRLLSLPVLIFYPWYFVYMYGIYFALEVVSYVRCGRKDPFWVVLIYPLYGLFGFITRVAAMCVFFYRRLVAKLARTVYFDDYKTASNITKLLTIVVVLLAVETLLLLYLGYAYTPLHSQLQKL